MGSLVVRFQGGKEREFFDVRGHDITVDKSFMMDLVDAERNDERYGRGVAGILEVMNEESRWRGSSFFMLECSSGADEHCMLFRILPGERSHLMGVIPPIEEKFRLLSLVNNVVKKKNLDVNLLI